MITEFVLTDSYELTGQWWLPHLGRDSAVGGTLECSPSGGVVLRLLDAIDPPSTEGWSWSPTEDDTHAEVIWGATFEGPLEVTLLDCESPGQPVPREAAALQSQTFRARWALFGIHAEESIGFERALIETSGVSAWGGNSGLGQMELEPRTKPTQVSVAWTKPEPITGEVDGAEFSLVWTPGATPGRRAAGIEPRPFLDVRSGEPRPLSDWLRDWVRPLRDLSTLLMDHPMTATALTVSTASELGQRGQPHLVQVFYKVAYAEPPDRDRLPLVGAHLEELDFGSILQRWFDIAHGPLRPVVGRTFSGRYRDTYLENEVLAQSSALELYHRVQHPQERRLDADVVDSITQSVSRVLLASEAADSVVDSVLASVGYIGEPTLKARVQTLATDAQAVMPRILADPNRFARVLTEVRNDAAHGNPLSRTTEETFWVSRVAGLILMVLLLRDIGVPDDTLTTALRRHARFNWASLQCNEFDWGGD